MRILENFRSSYLDNSVPMQATLELTYRCNERCSHCYLATYNDLEDGRPPLTLKEWYRILDQLADAGTFLLVFIGGEAMMHPHFWELADYAAKKNFALNLITNGILMDEKAADRIAALGFYNVSLSLYSLDPEIHDAMTTRKGSFKRTKAAIERLKERNVQLGINCLLTNKNIDTYFELEDWAFRNNIKISFDPLVTSKSNGDLGSTVTRASKTQLINFYRKLQSKNRGPRPDTFEDADPVCGAGRAKCAVDVYGDLLTCLEVRESIGSLKEKSFSELWNSKKADELRNYKNKDLKFDANCGDGKFCDHCPGMAGSETGDRMKPVPFLMEVAKAKRIVYEESNS